MSAPFKVGEVCIGVGFVDWFNVDHNGVECVINRVRYISEPIHAFDLATFPAGYIYFVTWASGIDAAVAHHNLRRKTPPSGEESILRMFDLTAPAPRETEAA